MTAVGAISRELGFAGFVSFLYPFSCCDGGFRAYCRRSGDGKGTYGRKLCSAAFERSTNAKIQPMASSKPAPRDVPRPFARILVSYPFLYPFSCSGSGFRVHYRRNGGRNEAYGSKFSSSARERSMNAMKQPMASSKLTLRGNPRPFPRFLVLYPFSGGRPAPRRSCRGLLQLDDLKIELIRGYIILNFVSYVFKQ